MRPDLIQVCEIFFIDNLVSRNQVSERDLSACFYVGGLSDSVFAPHHLYHTNSSLVYWLNLDNSSALIAVKLDCCKRRGCV